MSHSFKVAIPSYRRADILAANTLKLLGEWGVDWREVHVFCVEDERERYEEALRKSGCHGCHLNSDGPVGLHHMRNFISRSFPAGQRVLHIDDDIRGIFEMHEDACGKYPLAPLPPSDALRWIHGAFDLAERSHARLWGVYPVRNGFFMKDLPPVTTDLRFCVGAFWGACNDPELVITLEEKEDFERTLLAWERDHCVIRFNRVCVGTNYYKNPGGMQSRSASRQDSSRLSCSILVKRWPELCRLYVGKKNGMHEVRLINRGVLHC